MDFSIIVPTYNRPAALARCLAALAKLQYTARPQVIVVNDGGKLPSPELVAQYAPFYDLVLLNQPNHRAAAARNTGAAHARGDWLAFTDDDYEPAPDWLTALAASLNERTVVGGAVLNGLPQNRYDAASQALVEFLYDFYQQHAGATEQLPFLTSNNFALAHTAYEQLGGFDATMYYAEDRELCARLLAAGYQLRLAPAARVFHFRGLTLRSFWAQHRAYGRGAYEYHRRLGARGPHSVRVEAPAFYAALLSYPLRSCRARQPLTMTALFALAQGANAAGFALEWQRARRDTLPETEPVQPTFSSTS